MTLGCAGYTNPSTLASDADLGGLTTTTPWVYLTSVSVDAELVTVLLSLLLIALIAVLAAFLVVVLGARRRRNNSPTVSVSRLTVVDSQQIST